MVMEDPREATGDIADTSTGPRSTTFIGTSSQHLRGWLLSREQLRAQRTSSALLLSCKKRHQEPSLLPLIYRKYSRKTSSFLTSGTSTNQQRQSQQHQIQPRVALLRPQQLPHSLNPRTARFIRPRLHHPFQRLPTARAPKRHLP